MKKDLNALYKKGLFLEYFTVVYNVLEAAAAIFFGNAPDAALSQVLNSHGIDPATWTTYPSPYPSLLIESRDGRMLVDMGAGRLGPKTGNLWANLRNAGVALETQGKVLRVGCGIKTGREGCPEQGKQVGCMGLMTNTAGRGVKYAMDHPARSNLASDSFHPSIIRAYLPIVAIQANLS